MNIKNVDNKPMPNRIIAKNNESKMDNSFAVKKQDNITINSNIKTDKNQDAFILSLKNKIMDDVKKNSNPEVVKQIKEQILLKEYDINPVDIVRKIIR